MNWISKISVLFFALIILISSNGILLIERYCFHCEKTDIHLYSIQDCHSHSCFNHTSEQFDMHMHEEKHNVNFDSNHNPCSLFNEFYLKIGTYISSTIPSLNNLITEFDLYVPFNSDNINYRKNHIVIQSAKYPPGIIDKLYIHYKVFRT